MKLQNMREFRKGQKNKKKIELKGKAVHQKWSKVKESTVESN